MCHVKLARESTYLLLETKRNEKSHSWKKNQGRAFRDTIKEGKVEKRVGNLITTFLDFALAFSASTDELKSLVIVLCDS